MEEFKTIEEASKALKKVHSCATETDAFMAKCFPLMMQIFSNKKAGENDLLTLCKVRDMVKDNATLDGLVSKKIAKLLM